MRSCSNWILFWYISFSYSVTGKKYLRYSEIRWVINVKNRNISCHLHGSGVQQFNTRAVKTEQTWSCKLFLALWWNFTQHVCPIAQTLLKQDINRLTILYRIIPSFYNKVSDALLFVNRIQQSVCMYRPVFQNFMTV